MYPPNPSWFAKLFEGGKGSLIAAIVVAFWAGTMVERSKKGPWHDIARSLDGHWQTQGYHQPGEHDNHDKHTEREHEREYKRGEGHGRR
jgi:hypothetical protein